MYTTCVIFTFACFIIGILCLLYFAFQFKRLHEVMHIRRKWQDVLDKRYRTYSFMDMYGRTKKNWYGLKMPKEDDFK